MHSAPFKAFLLAVLFSNVAAVEDSRFYVRSSVPRDTSAGSKGDASLDSEGIDHRQLTTSLLSKLSSDKPTTSDVFYMINKYNARTIEVAGSSCSNGAQLQLANFTGGTNQQFRLDSNGFLYPMHCNNGAKVGLNGGKCSNELATPSDGTQLIIWDTAIETWEMSYGEGRIRSLTCSGESIDFIDPVNANATNSIKIRSSSSSTNQLFALGIHYDTSNELTFESRSSVFKVLSVATGGTNLQVWSFESSNSDQLFKYTGNQIVHIESGNVMSISGDDVQLGINLYGDDQTWFFFSDGMIQSLRDLPDGKVLGVATFRNYQNGDNMVVSAQSGGGNQQFDIKVISSDSSSGSGSSSGSSSSFSEFYEDNKVAVLAGTAIVLALLGIIIMLTVCKKPSGNRKDYDDDDDDD